jgi:hypothetical protein
VGIENVTWNFVRAELSRRIVLTCRQLDDEDREIGCFDFIKASSVRRSEVTW